MKFGLAASALLLTTTSAYALGLDRSGQDIGVIFQDGNYAELTFGSVSPSVSGNDVAAFGGGATGNVSNDYLQYGLGYKQQINDQVSFALIYDQPYGADIEWAPAASGGSVALGGTLAKVDSDAISLIGRYDFGNGFSAHAGLRYQSISADVTLAGLAYGPLNGYSASFEEGSEWGYLVGGAYERPDIALRVALTYFSEIDYSLDTTENGAPSLPTDITSPQAVNLDFQTGIAANTLLFGQIRWAEYSTLIVSPAGFDAAVDPGIPNSSLTDIDDGFAYSLGVGRRFSDNFAAQISVGYEPEGDDLVSPLAPTNGQYSVTLGGAYTFDSWEIAGGISYVWVGDAQPETGTPDTARATMTDNDAIGVGIRVAYTY